MDSIDGAFVVECDDESERATIVCIGELDLCTEEAMTLAVRRLDPRTQLIIFDLRYVTFADAAGLRPITKATELFGISSVSIQEPSNTIQRILRLGHFTEG